MCGNRKRLASAALALACLGAGLLPAAAQADGLLGLYVGAGVGQSNIRADRTSFSLPADFAEHHNGWKAIVGVRPLPIVGAELEYLDFGHPRTIFGVPSTVGLLTPVDVAAKATALFGVVYVPLPVVDLFAKAGVARLQTTVTVGGNVTCIAGSVQCCEVIIGCVPTYRYQRTDQRFAFGAGTQIKVLGLAVRAEYERISAVGGDPDLWSVSLLWRF